MKTDRIAKLYDGLSSEELAALCFNGAFNMTVLEIQRIVQAVHKYTYEMPDRAYMQRIDGIRAFAAIWGMTHWKLTALRYAANTMLLFDGRNAKERMQSLSDIEIAESRLFAMENVLTALGEKYGINPDAVRTLACTSPFFSHDSNLSADSDYQAVMLDCLERVICNTDFSPDIENSAH